MKSNDELQVTIVRPSGSSIIASTPIKIEHRRIVIMGDSFASGEGVPDVNRVRRERKLNKFEYFGDAYWGDQKCHRSLLAAGVQASMKWAVEAKNRSVTVLSYACSGAEIGDVSGTDFERGGILGRYNGRETEEQLRSRKHDFPNRHDRFIQHSDVNPLPSQINQAIRDLCAGKVIGTTPVWTCSEEVASTDLLILSIGGNDVGFGAIIEKAILGNCDSSCISKISSAGFKNLSERYETMANEINRSLRPQRVLMLDYGNPTKNEEGQYCKHDGNPFWARSLGIPGFSVRQHEYELAHKKVVIPLNRAGDQLVRNQSKNGWARLRSMESKTERKGICSRGSWFTNTWSAFAKQNLLPQKPYSSGTAHPNIIYHARQADDIVDWMRRTDF